MMDREARHTVIHGVAKSRTRLSDWTELMLNMILDTRNIEWSKTYKILPDLLTLYFADTKKVLVS